MQAEIRGLQSALGVPPTQQHTPFQMATNDRSGSTVRSQPSTYQFAEATSASPAVSTWQTTTDTAREAENHRMAMTRENSPDFATTNNHTDASVLVTEPMGSLYEVTRLRNIRSNQARVSRIGPGVDDQIDDMITRGVGRKTTTMNTIIRLICDRSSKKLKLRSCTTCEITAYRLRHTANTSSFHTSLNHYLWVGLEQIHTSLTSVRRSSQLLTATILTVTVLHIPTSGETFDKCYQEFLLLISSSMFSRFHSVDDVRALCIAAFWLSDGTYHPGDESKSNGISILEVVRPCDPCSDGTQYSPIVLQGS